MRGADRNATAAHAAQTAAGMSAACVRVRRSVIQTVSVQTKMDASPSVPENDAVTTDAADFAAHVRLCKPASPGTAFRRYARQTAPTNNAVLTDATISVAHAANTTHAMRESANPVFRNVTVARVGLTDAAKRVAPVMTGQLAMMRRANVCRGVFRVPSTTKNRTSN